jgi:hypothetical protein
MKLERKREMEQLKNIEEGLTSTGCCSVKCSSCHFHNWVFKHVQVQAYHKGFLLQLIFLSFLIMMVMVMMMTQNLWKLIPQVAMVGSVLA